MTMRLCAILAVAFVLPSTLGVRATDRPPTGVQAACGIVDALTPSRLETYARGLHRVLALGGMPRRTGAIYSLLQRGADLATDACRSLREHAAPDDTY